MQPIRYNKNYIIRIWLSLMILGLIISIVRLIVAGISFLNIGLIIVFIVDVLIVGKIVMDDRPPKWIRQSMVASRKEGYK